MTREKTPQLLFVLGQARSGTKLLRHLLNNHEQIAILPIETQFIPKLYTSFRQRDLADLKVFNELYEAVTHSTYATNARNNNLPLLSREQWYNNCPDYSVQTVFRQFLFLSSAKLKPHATVSGDKTPKYAGYVELLLELFPNAVFIHIVRDPRDRALSESKAWGKSLLKSVQNWNVIVSKLQKAMRNQPESFIECRYEALLSDTRGVLKRLVSFLGLEYSDSMAQVSNPTEQHGNAKGKETIMSQNYGRYTELLSTTQIRRMEEIAFPWLKHYQYHIEHARTHRPLNSVTSKLLYVHDKIRLVQFHCTEKGLVKGLKYYRQLRG